MYCKALGSLGNKERIFHNLRNYYQGSKDASIWTSDRGGIRCWSIKNGITESECDRPLYVLHCQSTLACQLFDLDHPTEAGQALNSATAMIPEILRTEHPKTLSALFAALLRIRKVNRPEVAFAILRYFSAFAGIILGEAHPLCQITLLLAKDQSDPTEAILQCLRSVSKNLAICFGALHFDVLLPKMKYIRESYGRTDFKQWENKHQQLLNESETKLGTRDIRTQLVRIFQACGHIRNNDFFKAKEMIEFTMDPANKVQWSTSSMDLRLKSLRTLNIIKLEIQTEVCAGSALYKVNAPRPSVWGPQESETSPWLQRLKNNRLLALDPLDFLEEVEANWKMMAVQAK